MTPLFEARRAVRAALTQHLHSMPKAGEEARKRWREERARLLVVERSLTTRLNELRVEGRS